MKDVIINIKGTQGFETDSDVIELTTYGTLSHRLVLHFPHNL